MSPEQEYESLKASFNAEKFYINLRINGIYYTLALINLGYLCYGTVSRSFVNRSEIIRIDVTPRRLQEVASGKIVLTQIAYGSINIDGYP